MKKTIGLYEFIKEFEDYGRANQFSENGLLAIFDLLNEIDENMEIDVIAICCEFSEYADADELTNDYNMTIEEIENETILIPLINGGIVIQVF